MGATDAWTIQGPNKKWVVPWFAVALNRTSPPYVHHVQVSFGGYTAYVAPRHADSTAFPYDDTDSPRFQSMMKGELSTDLMWYYDRKSIVGGAGWAPGSPCVKPPWGVCAPAFNDANERAMLYFNAEIRRCSLVQGATPGGICVVSAAWRPPAIPRQPPPANDTAAMADFIEEAGLLQVGHADSDAAVAVTTVEAYSALDPNDPHATFRAVRSSEKPVVDCCYQFPVATTDPDVRYATYDNAAQARPRAEMAWTTVSSCSAEQAFDGNATCINKTQPASLLRPSVPWPPPPPGAPPGPPRPPGSHVATPRRGLKSYVSGIDTHDSRAVLAGAATYAALAAAVGAILVAKGRQLFN